MSIITVVAYRPNAVDMRRNCVMDRRDSDMEFEVFNNSVPAAAEWIGAKLKENADAKIGTWEFEIFIDGIPQYRSFDDEDDDAIADREDLTNRVYNEGHEHYRRLVAAEELAKAKAEELRIADEAKRADELAKEAERQEQVLLNTLLEKRGLTAVAKA